MRRLVDTALACTSDLTSAPVWDLRMEIMVDINIADRPAVHGLAAKLVRQSLTRARLATRGAGTGRESKYVQRDRLRDQPYRCVERLVRGLQ